MVEARTHSFYIKLPTGSSEYAWGLSQAGAVSKYTFLKVAFDIWKGKKKNLKWPICKKILRRLDILLWSFQGLVLLFDPGDIWKAHCDS